jgi:hypothetical protein
VTIITSHPLTNLGWRYRRVAGSAVAHLVPARLGPLSRSACNRLSVTDEDVLETPVGLLTEIPLCRDCARADR